jgi:hypothetical protein
MIPGGSKRTRHAPLSGRDAEWQARRLQEFLDSQPPLPPSRPKSAAQIAAEDRLESIAEDRAAERRGDYASDREIRDAERRYEDSMRRANLWP